MVVDECLFHYWGSLFIPFTPIISIDDSMKSNNDEWDE
jgi:hypothetical protein